MIGRLIGIAVMLAASGQADTLRLRNGSSVNGSFLGGTADDVRFLVNDNVQHYARGDVAEIVFSSMNPPASSAAPPPGIDPGPDIVGAPVLRGASGYIPLEREMGRCPARGGMYGMGAPVYRIQGPRSLVRVRQGDRIVFVVRLNSGDDPRQFQLYRLESRMGYRQTQPTMGGSPMPLPRDHPQDRRLGLRVDSHSCSVPRGICRQPDEFQRKLLLRRRLLSFPAA